MSEPFVGEIRMVAFNFTPRSWSACDGQLLPINNNVALFSLLGTTYGGDGRSTFALPDLRGRVPIHYGTGPGLSQRQLGSSSGSETEVLNVNQIPSHSHAWTGEVLTTTAVGNQTDPDGHLPAKANDGESNYSDAAATGSIEATGTAANTGGGQGHNNMPPFLTLNFVIALAGIFPSRT